MTYALRFYTLEYSTGGTEEVECTDLVDATNLVDGLNCELASQGVTVRLASIPPRLVYNPPVIR